MEPLNKQKCSPECTQHLFQLKGIANNSKNDVVVCFCPKFRRQPHPPEKTIPQWNFDRKYYTEAFVLGTEKKNISVRDHHSYLNFQEQIKDCGQKNNAQISFPQPKQKNSFCSVCKIHFGSYYFHIGDENHREKIKAAIYNAQILKLCQIFRELWDGAQQKADKAFQLRNSSQFQLRRNESQISELKKKSSESIQFQNNEFEGKKKIEGKSISQNRQQFQGLQKKISCPSLSLMNMKRLKTDDGMKNKEVIKKFRPEESTIFLNRGNRESKYEIVRNKRRQKESEREISLREIEERREELFIESESKEQVGIINLQELSKSIQKNELIFSALETNLCDKLINKIKEKRARRLRNEDKVQDKNEEIQEEQKIQKSIEIVDCQSWKKDQNPPKKLANHEKPHYPPPYPMPYWHPHMMPPPSYPLHKDYQTTNPNVHPYHNKQTSDKPAPFYNPYGPPPPYPMHYRSPMVRPPPYYYYPPKNKNEKKKEKEYGKQKYFPYPHPPYPTPPPPHLHPMPPPNYHDKERNVGFKNEMGFHPGPYYPMMNEHNYRYNEKKEDENDNK